MIPTSVFFWRRSRAWLLLAAAVAACLLPHHARAAVTDAIESVVITNYTGYIISSDTQQVGSQFNRDHIAVEASVFYGRSTTDTNYVFDYELEFQLVDTNGTPQPLLVNGVTNTVVDVTYVVNRTVPQFFYLPVITDVNLTPVALNPYAAYSVRLSLYRRLSSTGILHRYGATGDISTTVPQQYITFPSLNSNDPAANAVAKLAGAANTVSYLINHSPAEGNFKVDVATQIIRYHHWKSPQSTDLLTYRYEVELLDAATMQSIPITQVQTDFQKSIPSINPSSGAGLAPTPYVFVSFDSLTFAPAAGVQLDPVNHTYIVQVSVSHFEQLSDLFPQAGNQVSTVPTTFVQFSGNLEFGNIATTFSDVVNPPSFGAIFADGLHATIAVDHQSGFVNGSPSHTYGNGTPLNVTIKSNGDAVLLSGSEMLALPTPDSDSLGNIAFDRTQVTISTNGAIGYLEAHFPTGFGYSFDPTNRYLITEFPFLAVPLSQALRPTTNLVHNIGFTIYGCAESKPVWIPFTGVTWLINQGQLDFATTGAALCVRGSEYSKLEGLSLANAQRADNSRYFEFVTGVSGPCSIRAAANGSCRLTAQFTFSSGQFVPHFPHNGGLAWNGGGTQIVVDDLVVPGQSGLADANPVAVDYGRDCTEAGCGTGIGPNTLVFQARTNFFSFTPDGGLQAAGALEAPSSLQWGWIPMLSEYAQSTAPVSQANFLMPGTFLRGDQTADTGILLPSVLLFTGVQPGNLNDLERPDGPGYTDGFADYPGLNFRVGTNVIQAQSVLAGQPSGMYTLASFSKYYVRESGVSGIHQAKDGTFPKTLKLYGYKFTFSNYGLSYLSGLNVDSRTDGSVYVPFPSDFTQDFADLKFSCLGAPGPAKVPANEKGLSKVLNYWNADFITDAIAFDRKADQQCNPGDGVLTLGVEAYAQHIATNIVGTLGFFPSGELITFADCQQPNGPLDPPFDSRLKLPNSFILAGPGTETYAATPVNDAYFNKYAKYTSGPGFVNIAAKLQVPFFQDLQVHMHTSASKNDTNALVYLMGGWPNKGFGDSTHNFFTENPYDTSNQGYPTAAGITPDNYRTGLAAPDDHYRVRAQQTWVEVVHFDYPLAWSPATRAFTSFVPVTDNLVVLQVTHQIQYLSAQKANIKFGAQFNLSPTADLANLAFDQLGGLESTFDKVISAEVISKGLDGLNEMLDADLHKLFSGALDAAVDPVIDNLYNDLNSHFNHANKQLQGGFTYAQFMANYVTGAGNSILNEIQNIGQKTGQVVGLAKEISGRLDSAVSAVDEVKTLIAKDPSGNRGKALELIQDIASTASSVLQSPDLSDKVNDLLTSVDPTLDDITTVLSDLESTLKQASAAVKQGTGVAQEIQTKINAATAQVTMAVQTIENDFNSFFATFKTGLDDPFTSMTPTQLKALLRQKVEDRLYASVIGDIVHHAIQQEFYDLNSSIREGMDSIMAQFNEVIHDLLSDALTELSDDVTNFLGGSDGGIPDGLAAAGQIDGYAHIVGNSLSELRLDIKADLKVPSEMKFHGYLIVKELNSSNTPASCLPGGGDATEVTLGATDIKVDWIEPDLSATIMAKFTFATSPNFYLAGFSAGFELDGPLTFETFTINQLGAMLGFGQTENFFSGDCAVEFNGYQGKGGIFFGRTCSLDPFYWDKDVQQLIGTPPFTGVYVYGEVWIPVSEALLGIPASCLFEVSAGVGAGAGFFVEGPTFIGKMYLGASGSLLCLISVEGDVYLVGVKNSQGLSLKGVGELSASIGPCPFCISFSKSIGITYLHGSWSVDF